MRVFLESVLVGIMVTDELIADLPEDAPIREVLTDHRRRLVVLRVLILADAQGSA